MTTSVIVMPTHRCQVIVWDMGLVDSNGKAGQIIRTEVLDAGGPQQSYAVYDQLAVSVVELDDDEDGEPAVRAAREYQDRASRGSDTVPA